MENVYNIKKNIQYDFLSNYLGIGWYDNNSDDNIKRNNKIFH